MPSPLFSPHDFTGAPCIGAPLQPDLDGMFDKWAKAHARSFIATYCQPCEHKAECLAFTAPAKSYNSTVAGGLAFINGELRRDLT